MVNPEKTLHSPIHPKAICKVFPKARKTKHPIHQKKRWRTLVDGHFQLVEQTAIKFPLDPKNSGLFDGQDKY